MIARFGDTLTFGPWSDETPGASLTETFRIHRTRGGTRVCCRVATANVE